MLRRFAFVLVFMTLVGLRLAPSEQITAPSGPEQRIPAGREEPADQAHTRRVQERELGKERYQRIVKDSEQLLKLATQLKQQVDTAGEHTLSLDVIKKAEEIEKLAKDVKNKMKG